MCTSSSMSPSSLPVLMYRGPGMRLLRALVRLKVLQAMGTASTLCPIALMASGAEAPPGLLLGSVVTAASCGALAACTTWYGNRYVGELRLIPPQETLKEGSATPTANHQTARAALPWHLRVSTLDAWGKRVDTDVELLRVAPPLLGKDDAQRRAIFQQSLLPLTVRPLVPGTASDEQYLVSPRFGRVFDRESILAVLDGTHAGYEGRAE